MDLQVVDGGNLGAYKVVDVTSGDVVYRCVRWDDAVLFALGCLSAKAADWVERKRVEAPKVSGRLIGAAHLYVLGRVYLLKGGEDFAVMSEFQDGVVYNVWWPGDGAVPRCTCEDYQRSVGLYGDDAITLHGRVVCKHILACALEILFPRKKEVISDGVASDRAEHACDAEAG